MSGIMTNQINNNQSVTPLYNYAAPVIPQQQTVAITTPQTHQVYQYPQTSVYNDPNKKPASGVNIYIYNPSAIGGPNTTNTTNYPVPQEQGAPVPSTPIANTPISQEVGETKTENKKTKNVTKLTNDYIKTLESFLRSKDKTIRKQGIQDLIKRYEEDASRYDDEQLTALLNIALQDTDANNRLLAMTVIASGGAHGDKNTILLLNQLKSSDQLYGQEAKLASNALLKASQTREEIEDNSADKPSGIDNEINNMYKIK